jgi:hypothetical protein
LQTAALVRGYLFHDSYYVLAFLFREASEQDVLKLKTVFHGESKQPGSRAGVSALNGVTQTNGRKPTVRRFT